MSRAPTRCKSGATCPELLVCLILMHIVCPFPRSSRDLRLAIFQGMCSWMTHASPSEG